MWQIEKIRKYGSGRTVRKVNGFISHILHAPPPPSGPGINPENKVCCRQEAGLRGYFLSETRK